MELFQTWDIRWSHLGRKPGFSERNHRLSLLEVIFHALRAAVNNILIQPQEWIQCLVDICPGTYTPHFPLFARCHSVLIAEHTVLCLLLKLKDRDFVASIRWVSCAHMFRREVLNASHYEKVNASTLSVTAQGECNISHFVINLWWIWRIPPSGTWRLVALVRTDIRRNISTPSSGWQESAG
jgi:hypothetical protein